MKLKDIIVYIHVSIPYKLRLTSPCGYVYTQEEFQEQREKFMDRKIYDITFRNGNVNISLFP